MIEPSKITTELESFQNDLVRLVSIVRYSELCQCPHCLLNIKCHEFPRLIELINSMQLNVKILIDKVKGKVT